MAKFKFTRFELKFIHDNLEKLSGLTRGKTWYAVAKTRKNFEAAVKETEDLRMELVKKYGSYDDEGNLKTEDQPVKEKGRVKKNNEGKPVTRKVYVMEDQEGFDKDFNDLMDAEVEIDIHQIKMEDFEDFPDEFKELQFYLLDKMII